VEPHAGRAIFAHYPDEEHDGIFEKGVVRLQRRDGGNVVLGANNHRESSDGSRDIAGGNRSMPCTSSAMR
jgi:hypothetical protein